MEALASASLVPMKGVIVLVLPLELPSGLGIFSVLCPSTVSLVRFL